MVVVDCDEALEETVIVWAEVKVIEDARVLLGRVRVCVGVTLKHGTTLPFQLVPSAHEYTPVALMKHRALLTRLSQTWTLRGGAAEPVSAYIMEPAEPMI